MEGGAQHKKQRQAPVSVVMGNGLAEAGAALAGGLKSVVGEASEGEGKGLKVVKAAAVKKK